MLYIMTYIFKKMSVGNDNVIVEGNKNIIVK